MDIPGAYPAYLEGKRGRHTNLWLQSEEEFLNMSIRDLGLTSDQENLENYLKPKDTGKLFHHFMDGGSWKHIQQKWRGYLCGDRERQHQL